MIAANDARLNIALVPIAVRRRIVLVACPSAVEGQFARHTTLDGEAFGFMESSRLLLPTTAAFCDRTTDPQPLKRTATTRSQAAGT
jgi:hypothetical protein